LITALATGTEVRAVDSLPRLEGEQAEAFLRSAEIVDREAIPVGVTDPVRLTLSDGERTAHAVWKTIDEFSPVKRFGDGGPPEIGFRDSYKNEIAAYELDKILGFGFVPPTVARTVGRHEGSVQLWIEDCITEGARRRQGLQPPDADAWSRQIYDARLFHQLIYDADYENLSNLLVDRDFRLWVVDQSRGFRTPGRLLDKQYLRRFSRRHLESLRALTADLLAERLGEWLSVGQREGLLRRRDLLLEYAEQQVAERGEGAVLY
jgi:hypothetical protein